MASALDLPADLDTDMLSESGYADPTFEIDIDAPLVSNEQREDIDIDLMLDDVPDGALSLPEPAAYDAVMDDDFDNDEYVEAEMPDGEAVSEQQMYFEDIGESSIFETAENGGLDPQPPTMTSVEEDDNVLAVSDDADLNQSFAVDPSQQILTNNGESNAKEKSTVGNSLDIEGQDGATKPGEESNLEHGTNDAEALEDTFTFNDPEIHDKEGGDDQSKSLNETLQRQLESSSKEAQENTTYSKPHHTASTADNLDEASHIKDPADLNEQDIGNEPDSPLDLTYCAVVQYRENTLSLFPPSTADLPETYLLSDVSLAEQSLSQFFEACREVLGNSVGDERMLEIQVPGLQIKIDEDSYECEDGSISQLLQLHYKLHQNDGVDDPEPLNLKLGSRLRYSARINELFEAVEASKGYAALLETSYHDEEYDENDTKHLQGAADETSAEHENQDSTSVDKSQPFEQGKNEPDYEAYDEYGEAEYADPGEDEQQLEVGYDEESGLAVSEQENMTAANPNASSGNKVSSASNESSLQVEPIVSPDDLIDYSEEEDNQPAETPRSSTVKDEEELHSEPDRSAPSLEDLGEDGDHVGAESSATHDAGIDIYGAETQSYGGFVSEVPDPGPDDQDNHELPATDLSILDPAFDDMPQEHFATTEDVLEANEQVHNAFDEFDIDLGIKSAAELDGKTSIAIEVTETKTKVDTEEELYIDWDDHPESEANVGSGPSLGSPLGKRSWEDHTEGNAPGQNDQEVKRVKS